MMRMQGFLLLIRLVSQSSCWFEIGEIHELISGFGTHQLNKIHMALQKP